MKLAYLEMCGFRGYKKPTRIEFADGFTVIDGRNGVGKSTVFDGIEFALTGSLGKYRDVKASGESEADYVWWKGTGAPPDRYVEVGFRDGDVHLHIRRTQIRSPDSSALEELSKRLCIPSLAPSEPLSQLCAATIIRDEYITGLSLDLKETDRYALLRDALGANDADHWIERGAELVALAKRRTAAAHQAVTLANADVAAATRRLDELRASLVAESVLGDAVTRLRSLTNSAAPPEKLSGPARSWVATAEAEIESLAAIGGQWASIEAVRFRLPGLALSTASAIAEQTAAEVALKALDLPGPHSHASSLATDARDLVNLVALGRRLGLREGQCPLCATSQTATEFARGIEAAESLARRLNEEAARAAEHENARRAAETRLKSATTQAEAASAEWAAARSAVGEADKLRTEHGLSPNATLEQVVERVALMRETVDTAQSDLRVLDTLRVSEDLERAQRAETDSLERLLQAQVRSARTRKAETRASSLHDAARRAAGETLDRRLERVLPLLSELYRRLRPHPVWNDIEYSIRGDVRRFMKLQVGEDLNPQFLFSSGQRRATGLAFLLSVNLSLAWSRWRTILLDDPVQHVDDFRTVHLAEVMAHLVSDGRQVVCAVEDAALADLLCRRLPVTGQGTAKRLSLGQDAEGDLTVRGERTLSPLARRALVVRPDELATG